MTVTITTGARAGNGQTAFAFTQGSTWDTPVAVGAGDGIRLKSEGLEGGEGRLANEDVGRPWGGAPDRGPEGWRGPLNGDLYYGGNCGKLLAFWFGTSGSPTQTPPSTGTSYLHECSIDDTLDKFFTFCAGKRSGQKWWEWASMKPNRLTLRGSGNRRVTFTLEGIASSLDKDSSTNTTTETDAVTVPSLQGAVRFSDITFRINAQGGSALAGGDKVSIASFELIAERAHDETYLADGTGVVAEPGEDSVGGVLLRVALRSYDADTWIDAWKNGTVYKLDLKALGTDLDTGGTGADPYYLLEGPHAVVNRRPPAQTQGRGRIPHEVEFKLLPADSAPAGMSGITQPLKLSVMDTDSAAYLS